MKLRKLSSNAQWRTYGGIITIAGIAAGLLGVRLSTLMPNLTPTEQRARLAGISLHAILANPLDLPFKLLQWLTTFVPITSTTLLERLPSVVLAFLSFFIFLHLANRWYGRRSMILGCALLLTSAWFLHVGRFGGTDIEYVAGILVLLVMHVNIHEHSNRPLMLYAWLVTNLVLLFIPGFTWLVAFSALWQWRTFRTAWSHLGTIWNRIAWALLALASIALLVTIFIQHTRLIRPWLGAPMHFAPWQTVGHHIGESFTALVWRAPHNPELWLGQLPLLDIMGSVMLLAGIIFYVGHWRAQRARLLVGYLLLGGILAGLGGTVHLSLLLPVVYLIIVGGIAYVLHFWLRIFPRNPIARGTGILLVGVVVATSCFYNLKQYFVAWPHNPETVTIEQRR